MVPWHCVNHFWPTLISRWSLGKLLIGKFSGLTFPSPHHPVWYLAVVEISLLHRLRHGNYGSYWLPIPHFHHPSRFLRNCHIVCIQRNIRQGYRFYIYSETYLERPLLWKTTCIEGHIFLADGPKFQYSWTKDHLPWETIFLWSTG